MRLLLSVFILSLIFSCQQKKPSQDKEQVEEKTVEKSSIQRIVEDTYNLNAYQQKKYVVLDLLLIQNDSVNVQIYLQPKNDLQVVQQDENFLYLTGESVYEKPVGFFDQSNNIETYKKLIQAYHLPFQLSKYQINKTTDSLQVDKETTLTRSIQLSGEDNFTFFLSPKTNLIKSIAFSNESNDTYLVYDQFITVQQIPISMRWSMFKDAVINKNLVSRVEVKKISYPEKLAFDFELPQKAKPIQNK